MWWYIFLLLFIVGLAIGSFLGALSYRYPRGMSIFKGRSLCPKCGDKIVWYDNIPILSFFLLGGRCRNCKKKISKRYPLIEISTALFFVLVYYFVGATFLLPYFLFLASLLLFIFVLDLEEQIIPDEVVFLGFIVTVILFIGIDSRDIFLRLFSGFLASLFLLLIHLVTKGRGMGLGDVKFALLGGLVIGIKFMPVWLFVSFLTGAAVGVILILLGKTDLKAKIAFGPFLIISLAITFLFGEKILMMFLS